MSRRRRDYQPTSFFGKLAMQYGLQCLREYAEHLTRWLTMRREMPWNNEPEPDCVCPTTRERVMRDFNRTF